MAECNRLTPTSRVYVAGHNGMVGSAMVRSLREAGYSRVLTRSRQELDLTQQSQVDRFFAEERPELVILAAAKVGGIVANNTYRAAFIRDNLLIQTHVIDAAQRCGIERLLFLGSSCIYPRDCAQPIHEDYLLSGPLEQTNEPYAVAKIAGLKLCEAMNAQYGTRYLSVMPTNLYGPNDNFDLETSHVLPAMIRRFHEAKLAGVDRVTLWGSGSPRREFLHVDDLVGACRFLLEQTDEVRLTNVGVGLDISIKELAELVCDVVGFAGRIEWDTTKPDGTPRKLLDIGRLTALGWKPTIGLRVGIESTYRWFVQHGRDLRSGDTP